MIKLTKTLKTLLSVVLLFSFITTINAQDTNDGDEVTINNADVGIFPGGNQPTKVFVPKSELAAAQIQKDFIVTGLKAAEHGKEIVIHATLGKITLVPNSTDSQSDNRIHGYNSITLEQGQSAELKYHAIFLFNNIVYT